MVEVVDIKGCGWKIVVVNSTAVDSDNKDYHSDNKDRDWNHHCFLNRSYHKEVAKASAGDNFKDIIAAANHRAATDADTAD